MSKYPKTIDFLKKEGIDPDTVSAADFTVHGYTVFNMRHDGTKVIGPDGHITGVIPWKDTKQALAGLKAFREDLYG